MNNPMSLEILVNLLLMEAYTGAHHNLTSLCLLNTRIGYNLNEDP